MRLSRQFQASLFFLRKYFKRTKSIKAQNKQLSPFRNFCARKIIAFIVFYSLVFLAFFVG